MSRVSRRAFLRETTTAAAAWIAAPAGLAGCRERPLEAPDAAQASVAAQASGRGVCGAGKVAAPPVAFRPPLHPEALTRFVDPLPIPPILAPSGTGPDGDRPNESAALYRVVMRETEVRVHRDLPPTRMWGYEGQVPGPTIETRTGHAVRIEWVNALPSGHFLPIDHTLHGAHGDEPEVRAVVHVHGAKAPPDSDGNPDDWYASGHSRTGHYPNGQDAATLWYHDHAMGIERLNQYAGLFGAYLIRDDAEDALGLPSRAYEVPLILCDRLFGADGQLIYPTSGAPDAPWVSEINGDAHLVNGKLYPYLEVEPRRYRLRVINASNSRFYYLSLARGDVSAPFHQIGSDQGLLTAPVPLTSVTVAPAERVDLIVDFGAFAGDAVVLRNQSLPLLQFRVAGGRARRGPPLPRELRRIARIPESSAARTRTLTLNEHRDRAKQRMIMLLNEAYWRDPVTELPRLDSVEIWSLMNLTEDTHPIHLHLVRFQILDRQKFEADEYKTSGKLVLVGPRTVPDATEMGWKDTVRADAGLITRIIVKFEGYAGRYAWHCHVLEHAANEMMRPFEVVAS